MSRTNRTTDKIDKQIGNKIHELRISMGLSRQQLAPQIDVTHQQLQKYEKGTNRISAGRMVYIAKALNKDVSYFFEGLNESSLPMQHQRMCIEVSRNFMKIENPKHQSSINDMIRTFAET